MKERRVFFDYKGDSIVVPPGVTLVGRGLSCDLRFNDAGVSREHLRVTVTAGAVTVEDLGSTNGTRVNDQVLQGMRQLHTGDTLQFGRRRLRLRVEGEGDIVDDQDEPTVRRDDGWEHADTPTPEHGTDVRSVLSRFTQQTCPKCAAPLPVDARACPACKWRLRAGGALSITQPIRLQDVERRLAQRSVVEIPVLYASATLTIEAVARDLSRGGVFVASEILDPIGTSCSVTMLPDGAPPVAFDGTVCHVIDATEGRGGRPPGLGIKFARCNDEARRWLKVFLERHPPEEEHQPLT